MTVTDRLLARLTESNPGWRDGLTWDEVVMMERRLAEATFAELGELVGLTRQGVRRHLFGEGAGLRRRGGILGHLRGAEAHRVQGETGD